MPLCNSDKPPADPVPCAFPSAPFGDDKPLLFVKLPRGGIQTDIRGHPGRAKVLSRPVVDINMLRPAPVQSGFPERPAFSEPPPSPDEEQQLRRSVMVDIAPEQALHLLSCRRAPDLTSVRDCTKRFSVQTELFRAFLRRTETVCLLPDDPARQETAQPPEEQACAADSRQYRKQEPFSHPCTQ